MLVPLGIGIIVSAIIMNISYAAKVNINVEKKARALGMIYPYELKVMEEGEAKDD